MNDTTVITMQPTRGFTELARSLRVAAAVAGRDGAISWPMTPEEARTLAKAIERLVDFPQDAANLNRRLDQRLAQMRVENRKSLAIAVTYWVMAGVLSASLWLP